MQIYRQMDICNKAKKPIFNLFCAHVKREYEEQSSEISTGEHSWHTFCKGYSHVVYDAMSCASLHGMTSQQT